MIYTALLVRWDGDYNGTELLAVKSSMSALKKAIIDLEGGKQSVKQLELTEWESNEMIPVVHYQDEALESGVELGYWRIQRWRA